MCKIYYKKGYKYQLTNDVVVNTSIIPTSGILTRYITLSTDGKLTILNGYAWDGPSGPTIDTKTFMRGSLVHDALYQLIRMGLLPEEARLQADMVLDKICKEDGMSSFRRWYILKSLRLFGGPAADPSHKKVVYTSP
jgi:hypothetical protein